MAEWLKSVVEQVNKQFDELPEWKKLSEHVSSEPRSDEDRPAPAIREPKSE
jgi:hypothetical protein